MAQPTDDIEFATNGAALVTDPGGTKKKLGFLVNEAPPAHWIDWMFRAYWRWINFFNSKYNASGNYSATAEGTNADAMFLLGVGTGYGITAQGGSGAATVGVYGVGNGSSGRGVRGDGFGSGIGVSGTGGATGVGVSGVGGATSGTGVTGTGTAGNAIGVSGAGQGSGVGVSGTGGATGSGVTGTGQGSGNGVVGTGGATGSGVIGNGGSTSGTGVTGTANTNSNNDGVTGKGGDLSVGGSGVSGVGGGNVGAGVTGTGTSFGGSSGGNGVTGIGTVNGIGVLGTGGSNAAAGVKGIGGAGNGTGGIFVANGSGLGIDVTGHSVITGVLSGASASCLSFVPVANVPAVRWPVSAAPSGASQVGDMYMATGGVLKVCTVAGTPGTYVSVGTQV